MLSKVLKSAFAFLTIFHKIDVNSLLRLDNT